MFVVMKSNHDKMFLITAVFSFSEVKVVQNGKFIDGNQVCFVDSSYNSWAAIV